MTVTNVRGARTAGPGAVDKQGPVKVRAHVARVLLTAMPDLPLASGTLLIPVKALRPPVNQAQLEAQGSLHVSLPSNAAGIQPVRLVQGPAGLSLSIALHEVDPGALVKMPLVFDIGKASTLDQPVPLNETEVARSDAGKYKVRVSIETVRVDRTPVTLAIERTSLANSQRALASLRDQLTRAPQLHDQHLAQLELNARAASAAVTDAQKALAQAEAQVAGALRGGPSLEVSVALGFSPDVNHAWNAFSRDPSDANRAAWVGARDGLLAGIPAADLARAEIALSVDVFGGRLGAAHNRLAIATASSGFAREELDQFHARSAQRAEQVEALQGALDRVQAGMAQRQATIHSLESNAPDLVDAPATYGDDLLPW